MIEFYLHGFGSHAAEFAAQWPGERRADAAVFLEGPESDAFTGRRRWFPFSAHAAALRAGIQAAARFAAFEIHRVMSARGLAGGSPVAVFGHSQGAMVALELVRRRRLNIRLGGCYCGYLPEPLLASFGSAEIATELDLFSSAADPYIPAADVSRTVAFFRAIPGLRVRHYQASHLPHTFSGEWLDPSNFQLAEHG